MGDRSHIEWTDATWNPVTGCTRVSAGCDHCYIERTPPFRIGGRRFDGDGPGSTTGVLLHPDRLDQPLRWKRPRRVFVNSLSDLFHDDIPDEYIARVFAVMAEAQHHTFQVLTKRPARMRALLRSDLFVLQVTEALDEMGADPYVAGPEPGDPLPNVWLGVSVEDQAAADLRIPKLAELGRDAWTTFLSCEPLLGPVDLTRWLWEANEDPDSVWHGERSFHDVISWVIAGGESGPGARPMHPDWARGLRDQCEAAGVAFHFKQWGEWAPAHHRDDKGSFEYVPNDGSLTVGDPSLVVQAMRRVGKKAAGRELDGRTHDDHPQLGGAIA